jgi:hypothetical protein
VVERYRLIDYEAAQEGSKDRKRNSAFRETLDPAYPGQVPAGPFWHQRMKASTTPWKATITYRPAPPPGGGNRSRRKTRQKQGSGGREVRSSASGTMLNHFRARQRTLRRFPGRIRTLASSRLGESQSANARPQRHCRSG